MRVILAPGERLEVEIAESDGKFSISYDFEKSGKLEVWADMPDDQGREDVVYCETFAAAGAGDGEPAEFEDLVIERDGVRVTWMTIGEGRCGDYDPDDPSDEPRLRVDVVVLENEHESTTYSYCTLANTNTASSRLDELSNELIDRILRDPSNPRGTVERWTHDTGPTWGKKRAPERPAQPGYGYLPGDEEPQNG